MIWELSETGHVLNPDNKEEAWKKPRGIGALLSTEEEIFCGPYACEAPERPNLDYYVS